MTALETMRKLLKEDRLRQAYISQHYFTLDTIDDRQYFFYCDDDLRFSVEQNILNYGLQKAKEQPLDGVVYTRDYHLEW